MARGLHLLRIFCYPSKRELASRLRERMPWSRFSGSLSTPKVDVVIDMGNPFLNRTVRWFREDRSGNISKGKVEDALSKMCKEGAYWGTVAGLYVGMEYGMERIRGTRDWKSAMLGGAITGALISAASNNGKDKVIADAISGAAVATAAEFVNYLA